jgi:hypothetical protein
VVQVNKAVIAVPAKFSPEQRQATAEAYKRAGLKVRRALNCCCDHLLLLPLVHGYVLGPKSCMHKSCVVKFSIRVWLVQSVCGSLFDWRIVGTR